MSFAALTTIHRLALPAHFFAYMASRIILAARCVPTFTSSLFAFPVFERTEYGKPNRPGSVLLARPCLVDKAGYAAILLAITIDHTVLSYSRSEPCLFDGPTLGSTLGAIDRRLILLIILPHAISAYTLDRTRRYLPPRPIFLHESYQRLLSRHVSLYMIGPGSCYFSHHLWIHRVAVLVFSNTLRVSLRSFRLTASGFPCQVNIPRIRTSFRILYSSVSRSGSCSLAAHHYIIGVTASAMSQSEWFSAFAPSHFLQSLLLFLGYSPITLH
jgi:hypothetical protein